MTTSRLLSIVASIVCIAFAFTQANAKPKDVKYELTCSAQPGFRFDDITQPLFIMTSSDVDNTQIYDNSQVEEKVRKMLDKKVKIMFTSDVSEFFEESFKKYAYRGGFQIGSDWDKDYTLRAKLKEFKCTDGVGNAPCTAVIEWELLNPEKTTILNGEAKGKHILTMGQSMPDSLDKAYEKALADIDWYGIARCLRDKNTNSNSTE